MPEDREQRRAKPLSRAAIAALAFLAFFGAAKVVVDIPKMLAETFAWSAGVKATVMIAAALLVLILFFVLWAFGWLRDLLMDAPLPGFTEKQSNALKRVACHIDGLKDRRGNRMTMMAGICAACTYIESMVTVLRYFSTRRYAMLAAEIGREKEFSAEAINRLADLGVTLQQDFKLQQDFYNEWHKILTGLDDFPEDAVNVMEDACLGVEEVVGGSCRDSRTIQKSSRSNRSHASGVTSYTLDCRNLRKRFTDMVKN